MEGFSACGDARYSEQSYSTVGKATGSKASRVRAAERKEVRGLNRGSLKNYQQSSGIGEKSQI
jgi:hypothetical protein